MKFIVGTAAVFCLGFSAPTFAQEAHDLYASNIDRQAQANQPTSRHVETTELRNPFLDRDEPPALVSRSFDVREDRAEMRLGPYRRAEFARAPTPDFIRPGKGAVGLAISLKLGS